MHSNPTKEQRAALTYRARKVGLNANLSDLCLNEMQQDEMIELIGKLRLEYGLQYSVILMQDEPKSSNTNSDFNRLLNAIDTITELSSKYNIPELSHHTYDDRDNVIAPVTEQLHEAAKYLRPPEGKQMRSFTGMLRKRIGEELTVMQYKNTGRFLDAITIAFKEL